ncbi:MAG: vanadium-dependent haloperoxidase [Psychroflexus sp.]|nr:vanadium-dependent haloperoxidase [Psychroflexus sp.]MDN6309696.1 vanadium-dependent haloperoxidase [Psychroflexus sp.]
MTNNSYSKILVVLCLFISTVSCTSESDAIKITAENYHDLNEKLTEIMVHDIFSPPQASRIYVYPNIAAYEVLSNNSADYLSLAHQVNALKEVPQQENSTQVNLRLAAMIAYVEVAQNLVFSDVIIQNYRDSLYNIWETKNKKEFKRAKTHAKQQVENIKKWMSKDNYAETRTMPDYDFFIEGPARWQPTPPGYIKGIEPHWDKIRPLVLDSSAQFKPAPHPEFSMDTESQFYREVKEIYDIGEDLRRKGNKSKEIEIARFWDCNPFVSITKGHYMFAEKKISPGGHWLGICKIANQKTQTDFEQSVYAYTKTSIAIFDAFISCWDEKYRSNLIRPETLIKQHIDPEWKPLLQTPPFPEYTSGHSVVSNAAAEVLTTIFGEDFNFLDTTEEPYGLPAREYQSFRQAAEEATISRLYGGIHYRTSVYEGVEQGQSVGHLVNHKLNFFKKENQMLTTNN